MVPPEGLTERVRTGRGRHNQLPDMTDNELRTPEEIQTPAAENAAEECVAEECVETTSPALDMAEAADEAIDNIEEQPESLRKLHSMTKEELIETLRGIVANDRADANREVAAIKKAFFLIRNREDNQELSAYVEAGNAPETFSATPDAKETELKELLSAFREKRNAYLEEEAERRQANLKKKQDIVARLQTLAEDIDNINLHFSKFHELQQEFRQTGEVPPTNETEIWKAYQQVEELFFDRLKMNKELRDLDFKKNLEAKRALIEQAEALTEASDVIAAFRKLQTLHEAWRETGPVAKEVREEIWEQFKKASTIINKRHQDYFETRKAEEQANETAKLALCAEVEAINPDSLQGYQAWDAATATVKDIQTRWRQLGFASRKTNTALFARFRQACDTFFARKAEYYKQAREDNSANVAKKRELIERAEALLSDVSDRKNVEAMAELQAEWKKTGHIARKQGEALWERFNAACNKFYSERKKTFNARHQEENANLEAKRDIIARLRALLENENRRESLPAVRALQEEWKNIGYVPHKVMDEIYNEYRGLCDEFYESLDRREPRRESRRGRDNRGGDRNRSDRNSAPLSERDRLMRSIETKKGELQTLENNLGFFSVKSKAGNSMVAEFERRIARLKEDIADLTSKIKTMDREAAQATREEK